MQQQLLVTKRTFAFMVYIEKDVAVVYVPENKELCNEIRIRSKFYFNQVLLPQLVSDHFYASHHLKSVIEDNSVIQVEMAVVHSQNVSSPVSQHHSVHHVPVIVMPNVISGPVTIPQSNLLEDNRLVNRENERSSNSFYCICQQNRPGEDIVVCRNVNCIVKVFHKSCIVPKRVRFGQKWLCKQCVSDEKKEKKSIGKENQQRSTVNAKRLPNSNTNPVPSKTRKPLQCSMIN